jgi:hypothetical protein
MDKMLAALKTNFINKVKENSTQPLKIKLHFNPYFMNSDSIYMKLNKVSREVKFDPAGI